MKKIIFLLPLILPLCSCSNTVKVTLKYMHYSSNNSFTDSEYVFSFSLEYERNYVISKDDLSELRKKAYAETPLEIKELPPAPDGNKHGYYTVIGLSFDKEMKEMLKEGFVLKRNILLYYSIIGA